jgi:protocatechuate 3,4-dioxygenase beta subunit
MTRPVTLKIGLLILLSTAIVAVTCPEAWALITGGEGNSPLRDPGWPAGAAAIFNVKARVAWWEGPPFGGGQWHAECRGDAKALSAVLADFAKLDVKSKKVVLHDGVGYSFWLNPNGEAAKREKAKMDWVFMVWQPGNWQHLRKLPAELNPTDPEDAASGPPSQIDVYTGGNIKWAGVQVPKELPVVDQRLEAHGFTAQDGLVLEGKVTDVETKKPIQAHVRLELIEPQSKGGYRYTADAKNTADENGHWVLKKAPAGWHRVIIEADGYVPRVIGYFQTDDEPRWKSFDGGLARPATVAGRLLDEAGQPLADVDVRIQDMTTGTGARYETAQSTTFKTGADGRFRSDQIPVGKATIWVHKPGYCRPGLGHSFTTPKQDIELTMIKAGRIVVTVDFTGKQRPDAYIVQVAPDGGDRVGTYGGSGHINDKNQISFDNVPPGRYVLHGRPNPGSDAEQTESITIDLKGGKTEEIKLTAK